ncbi:SRPBCC domain-containing protein [Paracoccus suum]|uniref:SRPBCC domain-containing protein n=1 Tax=Paracoccus suum TaxID=2259340 RepID=A0A344PMA4_9RHOB|nr:SRPBCC domain-containing protein [Paracoccus suum]AXC50509.1 SRPBCC domain-containing protein [Paracoccus suum]
MTEDTNNLRSIFKERELRHPPEYVWRALTQEHLIEKWLMKSDFKPEVGHRFHLEAEWGKVSCEVLAIEPLRTLSYSWAAYGLESVVTWTLTETATGTHLKMEQSGFGRDQDQAYYGAKAGWEQFLDRLEEVVANLDGQG